MKKTTMPKGLLKFGPGDEEDDDENESGEGEEFAGTEQGI